MAIRVKKKYILKSDTNKVWSSVDEFKTACDLGGGSSLYNVSNKQTKATEYFLEDGVGFSYAYYASTDDLNAAVAAYQAKVTNDSIDRAYTMSTVSTEEV